MDKKVMRRGGPLQVGARLEFLVPQKLKVYPPKRSDAGVLVAQEPEVIAPPRMETYELRDNRTIIVFESDWDVDTELDVTSNDRLVFSADGQIWAGVFGTGTNGPGGWNWISDDPKFPLKHSYPYSLIGKMGGANTYFYVGTALESSGRHDKPERLFLRTNDDAPGNGSGHFRCNIEVWSKT